MRKRVVVFVDIDTTRDSNVSGAGIGTPFAMPDKVVAKTFGADEVYSVVINPDPKGRSLVDITAHELGHILSAVYEIPGGMKQDPRTLKEETANRWDNVPTVEQADRIWANEVLAWKLAEKIVPNLNKQDAKEALDTYMEMFRQAVEREAA